jgi:hypothetical protein
VARRQARLMPRTPKRRPLKNNLKIMADFI